MNIDTKGFQISTILGDL